MPELPEVEVIVKSLKKSIEGLTISKIDINFPKVIKNQNPKGISEFKGKRIKDIYRNGKYIITVFSDGCKILTHLGMSGKLLVMPTESDIPKHSHLVYNFKENHQRLIFNDARRFGKVIYSLNGESKVDKKLSTLGVDPLKVSLNKFLAMLAERRCMIKSLLLDQTCIAGLGNIYIDESLFDAGIHPRSLSNEIPEQKALKLHKSMREILRLAIKTGGSSISDYRKTDGSKGYFQIKHKIYGKVGKPCPVCGTIIERISAGGRNSAVCIKCQVPPVVKPSAKMICECWWGS
ncbi:MAG: bifunctional DNA-formamidopyrimidine glycosylase/DNA-(apurinic or apyrimidinic site) lyase [candidate division Zixibacteria bacterium]|nr:bifunctional DNA-formamidopyrimidine glycosylase/DNA-(apurinic or apyrimidinic site) lyase [candidate division Zixibacteria bacterium]